MWVRERLGVRISGIEWKSVEFMGRMGDKGRSEGEGCGFCDDFYCDDIFCTDSFLDHWITK